MKDIETIKFKVLPETILSQYPVCSDIKGKYLYIKSSDCIKAMEEYADYVLQGRLEAQKPDLSEYYKEVIEKAQDVLTSYIVPNGISKDKCIEELAGILDNKKLYRTLNNIKE